MPESTTIAEPMSDNQALREILGELRALDSVIRGKYTSIDKVEGLLDGNVPLVRAANTNIVKTVVTNQAGTDCLISEGGALVMMLPPGETWVSPLAGNGEISVTVEAGNTGQATIATYRE